MRTISQWLIDREPNYGWQKNMVPWLTQQANMGHLQSRKWKEVLARTLTRPLEKNGIATESLMPQSEDSKTRLSCVMLRPESNPCFVSYPYYTKLASAGDGTFFRHCDMNIEIYLNDGWADDIKHLSWKMRLHISGEEKGSGSHRDSAMTSQKLQVGSDIKSP